MGSSGRYAGSFCGLAVPPPMLAGDWHASRGPANREWKWEDRSAAAAAAPADAVCAELPSTWRRQYDLRKNDQCTTFAATFRQSQQGSPTLLTLQMDRAAEFAKRNEWQYAMQWQMLSPHSASQEPVSTGGRDRNNSGDFGSECRKSLLCRTLQAQRQQQLQPQQLLGGLKQRHGQKDAPHDPRLLVGSCRAVHRGVGTTCVAQPPGRLEHATFAAAAEGTGAASSVLLHSVVSASLSAKTRLPCVAGSSFLCDPAAADCSGPPLDAAACGLAGAAPTVAGRRLKGASDASEGTLELKATACSGTTGPLDFEPFESFFESPYADDKSGFSSRHRDCSAYTSAALCSTAGERFDAFSNMVFRGSPARHAEKSSETQEVEKGVMLQHQTNEHSEERMWPQPHEYQRQADEQKQQEVCSQKDQHDPPALLEGSGTEEPAAKTPATQAQSGEWENAVILGPPEPLKETQLVSQVRVVQRDPTTGAQEERVVQVLLIHRNPEIFYIPDLLTDEECDHLIKICNGRWERSKTSTGYATAEPMFGFVEISGEAHEARWLLRAIETGHYKGGAASAYHEYLSMNSANRTSSSVPLAIGETTGVENVERLAAAFAEMNVQHLEPLVVVRYEPGQCFKAHHDGGFRPKTLLLYLNDVEEGGETSFENLGFCISPAKRAGVLWANAYPGTNIIDPRLLHAGLPPTKGTKYVVNCFFNKDPIRLAAA